MSRDWSEEYLDEDCCLKIYTGQLEKKLDIAVNALKLVKSRIKSFEDDPMNKIGYMAWWTLSKIKEDYKNALKQIEELDK